MSSRRHRQPRPTPPPSSADDAAFDAAMRDLFRPPPPPPNLRADVFSRIHREAPAKRSRSHTPSPRRHRRTVPVTKHSPAMGWAVAAAIFLAVGALILVLGQSPRELPSARDDAGAPANIVVEPQRQPESNAPTARENPEIIERPTPPDSSVNSNEPPLPHPAPTNTPSNSPRPTPDEAVNRPADENANPTPRENPTPDPVTDKPPTPSPTPDETRPETAPESPIAPPIAMPAAVLCTVAVDGRGSITRGDGSTVDLAANLTIRAGDVVELVRGTLSLGLLAPDDPGHESGNGVRNEIGDQMAGGRVILNGKASLALPADTTPAAPTIEFHDGEMFFDAACVATFGAVCVRLDDADLRVSRNGSRSADAFAGIIDRVNRRVKISVIAGGEGADFAGENLAGVASVSHTLGSGQSPSVRAAREGVAPDVPSWLRRDGFDERPIVIAEFDATDEGQLPWPWLWSEVVAVDANAPEAGRCLRLADQDGNGRWRMTHQFAHDGDAANYLPYRPGMELRVKIRAKAAGTITLHFHDMTRRDNFSAEFAIPGATRGQRIGEWQELVVRLDELRDRETRRLAPGAEQRFINFGFLAPAEMGPVQLDSIRFVRRLHSP